MQFEDPSEKVCEWILEYFLYAKLSSLAEKTLQLLNGLSNKRVRDFENLDLQKRFLIHTIRGVLAGGNENILSKIRKIIKPLELLEKHSSEQIWDKINDYLVKYEAALDDSEISKEQEDAFLKSGDCNKCLKMINEYLEKVEQNTRSPILKIIERDITNGLYIPQESIVRFPKFSQMSSQMSSQTSSQRSSQPEEEEEEEEEQFQPPKDKQTTQTPLRRRTQTSTQKSRQKRRISATEITKHKGIHEDSISYQEMIDSACTRIGWEEIRDGADVEVKKFVGRKRSRKQVEDLRKSSKELKEKAGDALSEALEQLPSQESQRSAKGKQPKKKRKLLTKEQTQTSEEEEEEEEESVEANGEEPKPEENEEDIDDEVDLINDPEFDLPEIKTKKFKDSLGGAQTSTSKSGRKKKVFWTEEEINNLKKGVKIYGEGNWSMILRRLKFDPSRDSISLRDKWRNICKKK